jgi:hypothetical protein
MTVTDDYTVFAGRYHPSSGAFSRPPLEVTNRLADAQEILHVLGVPQLPTKRSVEKKPHGKPTSRGQWPQGTFWLKPNENIICCVGNNSRKKAQVGKSLVELGCNALEVGKCGKNRRFICQCEHF